MNDSERIFFNADKQSELTNIATTICDEILWKDGGKMPKVPWFSQKGQEDAFYKVTDTIEYLIIKDERLAFDEMARSGVMFWALALVSANSKKFRITIAAAKRQPSRFYEAGAFLQWFGTETHPSLAVAMNVTVWQNMRENNDNRIPESYWTKKGLKENIT